MALDDVKRMETSILNFAHHIENWLETRSLRDDETPKSEGYTWNNDAELRQQLLNQRLERFAETQAEARTFIEQILTFWPSSKRYAKEDPLTFLRLVYLEFERIQNLINNDCEGLEQKLFLILDVIQDSIFDFEICKFDTTLKDWDYYLEDQAELVQSAYVHSQSSTKMHNFSPFPENRLCSVQGDAAFFADKFSLPFAVDKLVLSPEEDLVIRIKSEEVYCGEEQDGVSAALSFAHKIKGDLLADILKLAMKSYPHAIEKFATTAEISIRPYERPDFAHLSQDGKHFYRWYRFIF